MAETKTWRFIPGPFHHEGGSARANGWNYGIDFELTPYNIDEARLEVDGEAHFLTPDDCAALGRALLCVVAEETKLPGLGSSTRSDRFADALRRVQEESK